MHDYLQGSELGIATTVDAAKMAALFFDKILYPLPRIHKSPVPVEIVQIMKPYEMGPSCSALYHVNRLVDPSIPTERDAWYFYSDMSEKGVPCVPVFTRPDALNGLSTEGMGAKDIALEFRVLRAPVIDVTQLEWDHIMQLRADELSRQQLRRFRLMLHQDFKDKSEAFIQDSLLVRMEDYETACRKHGLSLITSVTSELLTSTSVWAAAGMAVASLITGDVRFAAIGAAPISLEIGKIAMQIAKHEIDADQPSKNPIAWIADLKSSSKQLGT